MKNWLAMAPNGARSFFSLLIPDILGNTDFDFENLYFLDLLVSQISRFLNAQIPGFPDSRLLSSYIFQGWYGLFTVSSETVKYGCSPKQIFGMFFYFSSLYDLLGVGRGLEVILRRRASSCVHMSQYGPFWNHFNMCFIFFYIFLAGGANG